ncbi:MAG: formylmethanofuran--tetrahydromethanopterin N-formyltransferase [Planctomycetota bacterium]
MRIADTVIENTFAEAFGMVACRVIVTANDAYWAMTAATVATGYACSVIGCDCEAGIEQELDASDTPDGRPGFSLLFFGFNREALEKGVVNRVGQCVMTCPTTACFNGLPVGEKWIEIGAQLRYFGDGHQISKFLDERRYWRIPVMDGEFFCEESFGVQKGVAGGNFLILAKDVAAGLAAARAAVNAIQKVPHVITPFPGGVVRAGSKVGSKYKKLRGSTNDSYCPTLRGAVNSQLPADVGAVYEIVIDGLTRADVENAMRAGILAACQPDIVKITAGNYGGSLGPHHLHLHEILQVKTFGG